MALRSNAGHGLLILEVSRSHTTTHHSRKDSSGCMISSSQRPLPDNTQHSQQTDIHAPGGIRTHILSRRAAVDLSLLDWAATGTGTCSHIEGAKDWLVGCALVIILNLNELTLGMYSISHLRLGSCVRVCLRDTTFCAL